MSTIRVRHLISALESLEDTAAAVDYAHDDGVGEGYHNHIGHVIEFLKDEKHFDDNDPIIEINVVG